MAARKLKRILTTLLVLIGATLSLSALLLLSQTAQNSEQFGRLHNWILLINAAGVLVLLVLIIGNLVRLVSDYRRHVPGSKLKTRMVTTFVVLAVVPLLIVYSFAVQFLNTGIDSWFDVEVEQGLSDALQLSRTALDIRMREYLSRTEEMAAALPRVSDQDIVRELGMLRRESGATELTVFGLNSRIVATSTDRPTGMVPGQPPEEVLLQIRQDRPYVNVDIEPGGAYRIRTAVALHYALPADEPRVLQALFPVTERLSSLADSVEKTYSQYGELAFLRQPLKYSFTLTLTLVLLFSFLAAVYAAFFFGRRLVRPIQQLVAGTRAVAKGDFDTQLPMPARDEMGFLVNSFNDMTKRLAKAREQTRSSQQQVESERTNLEVILARLSTGVVSLEPDLRIRTANQAAGAILGVDLENAIGEQLIDVARGRPLMQQFVDVGRMHIEAGDTEWREQIMLRGEVGRRVLMCACTALPGEEGTLGGYVVVFDDITALLQAQRDAAWGEVARRLAHEIKNPLTPIQLSAERLRRKYLDRMSPEEAQVLDRATHTIVQQVEAMKSMVNNFSEYARAPEMNYSRFDLNQLITAVADLYRSQDMRVVLDLNLDKSLPPVEADAGRIRQIIHNLIRNALEALEGRKDARVLLATEYNMSDGYPIAEILVQDNGPGFQMDTVEQVFDPYVTTKPKGTGLGLAIVKKLVEEHGGKIEARNCDTSGARVSILLPIDESARESLLPGASRRPDTRRERA